MPGPSAMVDDDQKDFEAVFAELRESFRSRLPEVAKELSAVLELCDGPPRRPAEMSAALERLQGTAHSLAGQGGTFGFPEISIAAADLEDYVEGLNGKGAAARNDAVLARLQEAIGSLLRITANC